MSNFLKLAIAIVGAFLLGVSPTLAQEGPWRVVETSGSVRTIQPMAAATLISTGETLGAGAILSTGYDGRVILARGDQQIVVGPNSRMALPAAEEAGMTRIVQDLGTLLFKVDKRKKQHFRVETPVIAAVVKGTTFTVAVGPDAHAVHVAEGAVEVSSRNGAARELVTSGRTARVSRSNPAVIQFVDSAVQSGEQPGDSVAPLIDDSDTGDTSRSGVTPLRKASLKNEGRAIGANGELSVPAVGLEPLDFWSLTDGLVDVPGNGKQVAGLTNASDRRNGVVSSSSDHGSQVSAIAQLRRQATNNNGLARAADVRNDNGSDKANSNVGGNGKSNAAANINRNSGGNGKSNAGGNGKSNGNGGSSTDAS